MVEVPGAICRMCKGKATRHNEIPAKFWKCLGRAGLEWLTRLFNVVFRTPKISKSGRWSSMIPVYKNKGDIQN